MSTDWMPRRREDQLAMARLWVTALPPLKPLLAVTDAEISELEDLIEDVETRQVAAQTNRGDQVLVAREREAFEAMVAYMRTLRRRRFFNYPMTSSQWLSLGLSPPDLVRTPHIDVTEVVEFELRLRNIREVLINFWIKGEVHHAKPAGYDGAVIIWDVLDSPPAVPDDLSHHTMASRTPHALEFREDQRGKTVYMALAWQNERGLLGQWSEIQNAVVP